MMIEEDRIKYEIAKRLGFKWYRVRAVHCPNCLEEVFEARGHIFQQVKPSGDSWEITEEPDVETIANAIQYGHSMVPTYSQTCDNAFLLVSEAARRGFEFNLIVEPESGEGGAAVAVFAGDGLTYMGEGTTPALAICKAWLEIPEGKLSNE